MLIFQEKNFMKFCEKSVITQIPSKVNSKNIIYLTDTNMNGQVELDEYLQVCKCVFVLSIMKLINFRLDDERYKKWSGGVFKVS